MTEKKIKTFVEISKNIDDMETTEDLKRVHRDMIVVVEFLETRITSIHSRINSALDILKEHRKDIDELNKKVFPFIPRTEEEKEQVKKFLSLPDVEEPKKEKKGLW